MEASPTSLQRARAAVGAGGPAAAAVLVLGLLGALVLLISEFSTIASVDVASGACHEIADPSVADRCSLSGFERHGGAFILLGLLAAVMAVGAARGGSRPAAAALVAVGAIVLVFALAFDLPKTRETGAIGLNFEGAESVRGTGLYLELVAGALLAVAGALGLGARRRPEG